MSAISVTICRLCGSSTAVLRKYERTRLRSELRLADVQQRALGVEKLVHAWLIGQARQLLVDRQARLEHRG